MLWGWRPGLAVGGGGWPGISSSSGFAAGPGHRPWLEGGDQRFLPGPESDERRAWCCPSGQMESAAPRPPCLLHQPLSFQNTIISWTKGWGLGGVTREFLVSLPGTPPVWDWGGPKIPGRFPAPITSAPWSSPEPPAPQPPFPAGAFGASISSCLIFSSHLPSPPSHLFLLFLSSFLC